MKSLDMGYRPCLNLLLAAGLLTPIITLAAEQAIIPFNIPAQSLAGALIRFSAATGLQVLYEGNITNQIKSPELKGRYTSEDALQKLLKGSGLNYRYSNSKTITLEKAPTPPISRTNQAEPITLPKVTVVGSTLYNVKDPYNQDYVLPNATSGTKTDTPIMETPLNVQVISKQVLKDQQVITLDQALRNVSGITMDSRDSGNGGGTLYSRGFATNTYFRNGFRLDNPSGYSMGMNDRQFSNVESVEVLKGASSILYGRTEPGGMVNIITKQPLETPYYAASQQFGNFNNYRTTIDSTGPLTKDNTLLYRINASFQNQGSFRDGVNTENYFVAPIVKWNISPRTQATLEMEFQHDTSVMNNGIVPTLNNQLLTMPYSRNYFNTKPNIQDTYFIGFNWSHQFNDDWSVKHRVQVNKNDFSSPLSQYPSAVFPVGGTPTLLLPTGNTQMSMDTYSTGIDLTGHFNTGPLKHTLLFGGDYYRYTVNNSFAPQGIMGMSLLNPVQPGAFLSGNFEPGSNFEGYPYSLLTGSNSTFQNQIDNYGLYGQDQIELPYHIHVLGGIRYQNIHETEVFTVTGSSPSVNPVITADAVTPRVGLLWQPQHWLSLYSNYAEGFGVNTGFTYPAGKAVPPTGAEQWEIGAKTEFFNGRLRATLAYFDLTKTNIATPDPNPTLAAQGYSSVTGAARTRGPELDIQGEILPGWNVIGNYANLDAVITQSNNGDVGNRFYNVPRNLGKVWTTYEVQQGNAKGLKFGGGVTLQDGLVGGYSQSTAANIPGYATVSLMSGYSFNVGKPKITLQLNVDNLLDKQYYTNGANYSTQNINATGYPYQWDYRSFGMPRTFIGSINIQY